MRNSLKSSVTDLLNGLLLFNGLTAVAGGLFLLLEPEAMPLESLESTAFTNYYLPGVILFALVGGSALVALVCRIKSITGSDLLTVLSGMIMLFWIVGEIASIKQFHLLQIIYLVTGLLVIRMTIGRGKV